MTLLVPNFVQQFLDRDEKHREKRFKKSKVNIYVTHGESTNKYRMRQL